MGGRFSVETCAIKGWLQGADLGAVEWSGLDLRGAQLQRVNMQGALLCNTHLEGSDLQGANLQDADMRETALTGVYTARLSACIYLWLSVCVFGLGSFYLYLSITIHSGCWHHVCQPV